MEIKDLTLNSSLPPAWWRPLIIILLVLGIFFRLANLDRKIYWRDEALTSLQISGYTIAEATQGLADGRELSIADLQKYQNINSERNLFNTVKALAIETPEHPPVYYAIARLWAERFGTSQTAMRSLPAILSLFVFPCLYWLCLELFASPAVAWVAIALVAVSPFHVLYAQEAREYSFWTATTLLASAALLRAMRLNTAKSWTIYTLSLALALYSYLFSVFVAIGHGIYAIVSERFQFNKKSINYLLSAIAGTLLFLPWIIVLIINLPALHKSMAWINYRFTISELIWRWIFNINRIFIDWNYGWSFRTPFPYLIIISNLLLVGYALYFLCRHTPPRIWVFVLSLSGVILLALVLPDLIIGGGRSKVQRYLIPFYLGIQIAVAYLLATKITSVSVSSNQKKIWQLVTAVIISGGVLSCALSSQASVWWHKSDTKDIPQIVQTTKKAKRPLIVSDALITNLLSLSHQLDPKVKFQLFTNSEAVKIAAGYSDVFLFAPSPELQKKIEKDRKLELVRDTNRLWRIEN